MLGGVFKSNWKMCIYVLRSRNWMDGWMDGHLISQNVSCDEFL